MISIKLTLNKLLLTKECALIAEDFYDPFADFYLLPIICSTRRADKLLIEDNTHWSNHSVTIGYNNTRQFGYQEYEFKTEDTFHLRLYLIQQVEHEQNKWLQIQYILERGGVVHSLASMDKVYLLELTELTVDGYTNKVLDNKLLKGKLTMVKKGYKGMLPPKRLPTAFAAWSIFEPSRPYFLEPVSLDSKKPPGINPKVVSSVYGKIKTIVLFYPSMQEGEEKRIYCYSNFIMELIGCMSGEGRCFILVVENHYCLPTELKEVLHKIAQRAGHTLEIVAVEYSKRTLSPWVQDAFLPIQFENEQGVHTYLVESMINYHYTESAASLVDAYAGIGKFRYQESSLPFVGGNVLSGDGFLLIGLHQSCQESLKAIGASWLGENYILLSSSPTPYIQQFTQGFRTSDNVLNYYEASTKDQILFHLDLFITLAGKGSRRSLVEYIVVGEPVVGFEGLENAPNDVQDMVKKILSETSKAIDEIIGQIKKGMLKNNKRCEIIRNPLPLTYYDQRTRREAGLTRTRYWCWASYNNCLVEHYKEKNGKAIRRVFLPSYGQNSDYRAYSENPKRTYGNWTDLEKFDEINKEVWRQKLDYEVIMLHQDFNPFIRYQGSLNCLTNCVERE